MSRQIEEMNYHNDSRVIALSKPSWFVTLTGSDTNKPTHAVIRVPTADYEWLCKNSYDPEEFENGDTKPLEYGCFSEETCDTCKGTGVYTNYYGKTFKCPQCAGTTKCKVFKKYETPIIDPAAEDRIYRPYKSMLVPVKTQPCETCNGKGHHVNPSIDASGISSEDFDRDPDFRDEYFSGRYDVACYECNGVGNTHIIDMEAVHPDDLPAIKRWEDLQDEKARDAASYEAERAAERRMGC